ncbi:RluA family pseudouridine synthase [bacterium]|nr:RluA family pseudouridine synthase [bacterium]
MSKPVESESQKQKHGRPASVDVVVAERLTGQTVAKVIKAARPDESWNRIRKLFGLRRVAVNGVLCLDDARRVATADVVSVFHQPLPPPPGDNDVVLRHFDESIVVVEKPSGMVSRRHIAEIDWPAQRRRAQPSLDEVVIRIVARETGFRRDPADFPPKRRRSFARSIHRLDRDTSGLIVFARTVEAEQHLVAQFTEHSIERVYEAVVSGTPNEGTIESQLVRDRGDGLRGSVQHDDVQELDQRPNAAKRAVTHVRVLRELSGYSLVECRLETGRTHQIRIHLSESGHAVCGDGTYRAPLGAEPIVDQSAAPRLALHATRLGLTHPATGERLIFDADLPSDLRHFVERLASAE